MSIAPVTHCVVDADYVAARVAEAYNGVDICKAELFSRAWSDVYRLFGTEAGYAARLWRAAFHGAAQIRFGMELIDHLALRGVPVARPLRTRDGASTLTIDAPEGARPLAVYPWLDADKAGLSCDEALCRRMGELLAQFHLVAVDFEPTQSYDADPPTRYRHERGLVERFLSGRRQNPRPILEGLDAVASGLEALCGRHVPRGTIHGDFHHQNILVDGEGCLTVIDFDDASVGFLAQDVASFLWAVDFLGQRAGFGEAFVAGYEAVRPLTADERSAMPLLMAERYCWTVCGWAGAVNVLGSAGGRLDIIIDRAEAVFAAL